jgi:hypothetical protein
MAPDDEHVLAEVMLAKTPNDDEGANNGNVARIVTRVVHFRTDLRKSLSKRP